MSELQVSALVVLVPDAEPLVSSFRKQYDPSAEAGMPAHISVLYPFVPAQGVDAGLLAQLEALFLPIPSFKFSLSGLGRFPGVLYLEPAPSVPFAHLTQAVVDQYPDYLPYGGAFADVVPHLTVAHSEDSALLAEIEAEFLRMHGHRLPVTGHALDVALMAQIEGTWEVGARFRLEGS